MTNERKENIVFMAEGIEGGAPKKISLEHRERGEAKRSKEPKEQTRYGRKQQQPETPPASTKKDHVETSESDAEKVAQFPTAPDRKESPEEQAAREWQEGLDKHIEEKNAEGAFGMVLEKMGLNPEEEFQKPEVQKSLQEYKAFAEEKEKPEGERNKDRLEAAAQGMKDSPKYMHETYRNLLRAEGMPEEDVKRFLPETPAAPTEEEGEGEEESRGITAPTEDDQRREQEREVEAAVKPFVQKVEDRIAEGDWKGAEKAAKEMMDIPWGKILGGTARGLVIAAISAYVAYIFLMAKTGNAVGKK